MSSIDGSAASTDVVPERLRPALAAVIARIVEGDFAGLVHDGFAPRHTESDLGLWVRDYPGELVSFPEQGWRFSVAVAVVGRAGVWSVDVPLWTDREGRCDIELHATVIERDEEILVEVDDIHVP